MVGDLYFLKLIRTPDAHALDDDTRANNKSSWQNRNEPTFTLTIDRLFPKKKTNWNCRSAAPQENHRFHFHVEFFKKAHSPIRHRNHDNQAANHLFLWYTKNFKKKMCFGQRGQMWWWKMWHHFLGAPLSTWPSWKKNQPRIVKPETTTTTTNKPPSFEMLTSGRRRSLGWEHLLFYLWIARLLKSSRWWSSAGHLALHIWLAKSVDDVDNKD